MSPAATTKNGPLLSQLPANLRLPLIFGVSATVAALAAMWLWVSQPDYGVLYSNVSDRDGGAIIASLQQMNIPFKFAEGGGALLVAANKVPEARLRLAAQGLPKGGTVGFELMDNQKFGTSQFAEQVNYQRALEGELARSINSISAVSSARVHLALPKSSLFVREQKKPSASVILTLNHGRSIDEGQVSAIVHMLSSSVPELSAKNVTVVDQAGNLLSAANSGARGLDTSQLKYTQEIEQSYMRRIEAILQPIVGSANVHAQVAADIDFSIVENTDETYQPNQEPGSAAIRSQQSSESSQGGASAVGGVPGALSNQPPANPAAPIVNSSANRAKPASAASPAASQPKANAEPASLDSVSRSAGNGRKDGTTNYELDRSIRHVQQGAGTIKRLSAAVVVNHRSTVDAQGKRTSQALPAAELEQIQKLVKEAMGFSEARGDTLNVVNSAFAVAAAEPPEAPLPLWRQPANVELAKVAGKYLLLGIVTLYIWFGVLRPLLGKALQPAPIVATPAEPQHTAGVEAQAPTQQRQDKREHENLQYAQEVAATNPGVVAAQIKSWTGKK